MGSAMLSDLRLSFRRLVSQPTFTLTAVATLAVGVGATTAIFSTVNATLLRPLAYPRSEDIFTLNTTLVGAVLYVWLIINYGILTTGTVDLLTSVVDLGESRAGA